MTDDPYDGPVVLPDDTRFGMEVQPDYPGYRSTRLRAARRPFVSLPEELLAPGGPVFGEDSVEPEDADLTAGFVGEPIGERIIVSGKVVDEEGRPIRGALVEVWQANAAGRYRHVAEQHPAPLDPNFDGGGRCLTGDDGSYRFVTIKPGAYPWGNHPNAWRPAHIHFSLFGRLFTERLVTQMFFPGDPLQAHDPIMHAVRDPRVRELLICRFDLEQTIPEWALAFHFDIVLGRGRSATPLEES